MEGGTYNLFLNSWTNGPCFLPSPMFPKSIALLKSYIISPYIPAVLSIISTSQSLQSRPCFFQFSHTSATPSFYIIFRFSHSCLCLPVSFSLLLPCQQLGKKQHMGWLAESNRGVDWLPHTHGCSVRQCQMAQQKVELSPLVLSSALTSICSLHYPASIFYN